MRRIPEARPGEPPAGAVAIPDAEPARSDWLRAELSRPAAWPHPVEGVECRRTLISLLFFAGERVYKLKQAVDLGYIDTRAPEERLRLCREEVRLNAELAPGVHLGVVPVALGEDGHLHVDGAGPVVEWAVVMRRLDAERMLARLLERGEVGPGDVRTVAALLARFHAGCATGPGVDEHGAPAGVARAVLENLDGLEPFAVPLDGADWERHGALTPAALACLRGRAQGFLDGRRELLERRVREGRIRDGHGDLHAENLCREDAGWIAFDRLEFSRALRCTDVAADLGFLAMDLDARGHPELARELEREYVARSGDAELPQLSEFYRAYRALVRAKVAALGGRLDDARAHVHLALGYGLRPALVLVGGLPGTGKSTFAPHLARPLRARVLQSDVVRKERAGLAAGTSARAPWGEGLYAPQARADTYAALCAAARSDLAAGRSAVVDASFARREFRRPFVELAAELGVPCLLVEVEAPLDVVRERLAERSRRGGDASDADLAVHLRARAEREPPEPGEGLAVVAVDTAAGDPETRAARALERLGGIAAG